uniref:Na+/proline symporter n=1 Tax=Candidatus Kentrum sp. FW TaxID=2126338 RepID=A0A450TAA5_9GAMM|nr:MAG: Na+/proline symporter [Candidatus Kentron sp. FW]
MTNRDTRQIMRIVTYFVTGILIIGWFSSLIWKPDVVIWWAVMGPLLIYLLLRIPEYKKIDTPDGYFLHDRQMPSKRFVWTFVTTNIGLFSSIAFSAILAYYYGVPGMVWTVVAWFLGIYWFSKKIPEFLWFFKNGSTVHEFIAESYGTNDREKIVLRAFTAAATGLLYWASVGVEIKFGADVLAPSLGINTAAIVSLIIAAAGFTYTYLAGYRGVIYTDVIQFWTMLFGAGAIILFIFIALYSKPFSLPAAYFSLESILIGPDPFGLFSLFALLVVYQFCVMDMWQRCIAVANSPDFNSATDEQLIYHMKEVVFWKSFLPFLLFFLVWFTIGIFVLGTGITDDINNILPAFLAAFDDWGIIGIGLKSIVLLAFVSAILSTVDSFLIAATQTVMYDIYGSVIQKGLVSRFSSLSQASLSRFVEISRLVVLGLGISAVIFAFTQFNLMSFWVGMYSIMLSFFPAVYVQTLRGRGKQKRNYKRVLYGILGGSFGALAISITGTFVLKSDLVTYFAPFVALGLSGAFIFPANKEK